MIPKKIYLTKKELQDTITCERMVSIDEPYKDVTEEYVNISQMWHDVSEEPKKHKLILVEVITTLTPTDEVRYYVVYVEGWVINFMKTDGFKCRWAYIEDLLPKGGEK